MDTDLVLDRQRQPLLGRSRLMIAAIVMVTLTIVLLQRFYYLQIVEHDRYRSLSIENRIDFVPVPSVRGMIYDLSLIHI